MTNPFRLSTIESPVFIRMKHPVPYVFFISPASKQVCPNSAACWSPNDPTSKWNSRNTRYFHTLETTGGDSIDLATGDDAWENGAIDAHDGEELIVPVVRADVHHHRATRIGDVGDVQTSLMVTSDSRDTLTPPVRFQINQLSIVPTRMR